MSQQSNERIPYLPETNILHKKKEKVQNEEKQSNTPTIKQKLTLSIQQMFEV